MLIAEFVLTFNYLNFNRVKTIGGRGEGRVESGYYLYNECVKEYTTVGIVTYSHVASAGVLFCTLVKMVYIFLRIKRDKLKSEFSSLHAVIIQISN